MAQIQTTQSCGGGQADGRTACACVCGSMSVPLNVLGIAHIHRGLKSSQVWTAVFKHDVSKWPRNSKSVTDSIEPNGPVH